jgi:hypothetical protein
MQYEGGRQNLCVGYYWLVWPDNPRKQIAQKKKWKVCKQE